MHKNSNVLNWYVIFENDAFQGVSLIPETVFEFPSVPEKSQSICSCPLFFRNRANYMYNYFV